jgi:hypothetical protein
MLARTTTRVVLIAAAAAATPPLMTTSVWAEARRCTLAPGTTVALVHIDQDTTLASAPSGAQWMSASGVRPGPLDSLLATPSTQMPAARVRLLDLDANTRAALAAHGITDRQPVAFLRAAPYRADCRPIRWTDTVPFVKRGEAGFVRATLAPREAWINGVPVLVIPDAWNYPYPHRRGGVYGAATTLPSASAEAMFSITRALDVPPARTEGERIIADSMRRARAVAWARENPLAAETEPPRTLVRRAILDADWAVAQRNQSRLRGTYRVTLESGSDRGIWFFRTHERPGYSWVGLDSVQSTASLLASPHIQGYRLVGYAGPRPDSLPEQTLRGRERVPMIWLATVDRPTAAGNDDRLVLPGILEFTLAASPERFWNDLETLVARPTAADSAMLARMNFPPRPRGDQQPRIPLTIRLDRRGGIRGDTTITVNGRSLRVLVERMDTLANKRPY